MNDCMFFFVMVTIWDTCEDAEREAYVTTALRVSGVAGQRWTLRNRTFALDLQQI